MTLMEELRRQGTFESEEESKTRSASPPVSHLEMSWFCCCRLLQPPRGIAHLNPLEKSCWDVWRRGVDPVGRAVGMGRGRHQGA